MAEPVRPSVPAQPLFGMASTFMFVPRCDDPERSEADVIVSGVPFDLATTGRPGARLGPTGIRLASANLAWEHARWPWGFSLTESLKVEDMGDVAFDSGNPQSLLDSLATHAQRVLGAGKTMLTLGGDHFVSLPLIRAHAEKFGELALIHFDSHTDSYDEGGPYDHGIMMREVDREGAVDPAHSVQVGIRTEYHRESHRFNVLDAAWCNERGPAEIAGRIKEIVAGRKAYLTLDIDCLDPAYAPGTGTPVIGGLSTDALLKVLRDLVSVEIVGMDLVEVAPPFDHAEITSLAAATLALELLYVLAARRSGGGIGPHTADR